jgi:hypothetical protein
MTDTWEREREFLELSRALAKEESLEMRLERAHVGLQLGKFEEALMDARMVVNADSSSASAFACVGAANAALMRYEVCALLG